MGFSKAKFMGWVLEIIRRLSENEIVFSISRKAKIITTGIH